MDQRLTRLQINLYEPAILVVGTRGRSLGGFQGLLPGSVSKYCLQHSPVPVIVVRPSSKRDKSRVKRAQDPNRHAYKDLLEKSGAHGSHMLDAGNRNSFIAEEDIHPVSDDEAAAVAAAIGYKPALEAHPLAQVQTASADDDERTASALEGLRSPGVVMKSPELQNLDSPEISDLSTSEDEEQGGVPTTTEPSIASETTTENSTGNGEIAEPLTNSTNAIREPNAKSEDKDSDAT